MNTVTISEQPFRFSFEVSINGVKYTIIEVDMILYDCEHMGANKQLLTVENFTLCSIHLMFLQGEADKNLP